jgi:ketosteroid isomerase-like protein
MSESNAEIARRGFEAVTRGDFDTIAELLAPDVQWHGGDPTFEGACHNRGEALTFMRRAVGAGRLGELVEVIDAGDQVVVVMQPPDGSPPRANLTTFRDGKVVEMVAYESPDAALAASALKNE